jgi:hypothetical protein
MFARIEPMIGTVEEAVTEGVTVVTGVLVCDGVIGTHVIEYVEFTTAVPCTTKK